MIEAAKVEERPDVLRDQAVLRFKIQPTIPLVFPPLSLGQEVIHKSF